MPRRSGAETGPNNPAKTRQAGVQFIQALSKVELTVLQAGSDTSSNLDAHIKRAQLPVRASSHRNKYRSSQKELPLPPLARSNGRNREPVIPAGLFGDERGTVKLDLVRRLDKNLYKAAVPGWLSNTYNDLPSNNPLRLNGRYSSPNTNQVPVDDDDGSPFAFQPPTPSSAPVVVHPPLSPAYPQLHAPRPRLPMRHMNMAAMSAHIPPLFVEPVYQEEYRDMSIPLNDHADTHDPAYYAGNLDQSSPDLRLALEPAQYPISPQPISSSLFISHIHHQSPGVPQLSPIPSTLLFSSDDTIIPTPPHNTTKIVERDGVQDMLRNRHSFVSPVYPPSPILGDLALNAPKGNYMGSSRFQTSSPILSSIWNNSPKLKIPTSSFQPYSDSSDIYKARLLAYATTAADQLSSSGRDELIAYRRWGDAAGTVANDTNEVEAFDEAVPTELAHSRVADGRLELVHDAELQPHRDGAPLPSIHQPQSELEPIREISSQPSNHNGVRGFEKVNHIGAGCLEDWDDEPIGGNSGEAGIRLFPEDENDLVANELLDDGEADDHLTPVSEGPTIPRQVEVLVGPSHATATPSKGNPPPFTGNHRDSSNREELVKSEKLANILPKLVTQPTRRIRPSPFAHLLKNRRTQSPNDQAATAKGDVEDEIESWPT
ncbi:hypothetical protein RhiLY_07498 [Ceratobasidium sp. AG-Ba]|nr:hypothetical protein RhiLY_07498 [Ceratobasidium sp. AG-Ba]